MRNITKEVNEKLDCKVVINFNTQDDKIKAVLYYGDKSKILWLSPDGNSSEDQTYNIIPSNISKSLKNVRSFCVDAFLKTDKFLETNGRGLAHRYDFSTKTYRVINKHPDGEIFEKLTDDSDEALEYVGLIQAEMECEERFKTD